MGRSIMTATLTAAALTLLSSCVQAQEINPRQQVDKGGAQRKPLAEGPAVESGGERYVLLPEVRAVHVRNLDRGSEHALASMGVQALEVLETKGHLVLYRRASAASPAFVRLLTPSGHRSLPVVRNERTGQLGVVPGTITVKLRDVALAEALASDHGLVLELRVGTTAYGIYRVAPSTDPFAAASALRADVRVADATVEILENVNVPY